MFDIETKINDDLKYFKVKMNNLNKFKYFFNNNNNEKFKDLIIAYYHAYSKEIVFSKKRNSSDRYINIIVKQKEHIKYHKILKLFTYKKTKIIEYELIAELEKIQDEILLVKIYNNNAYNLLYSFCKNWSEDNEISLIFDVKDVNNIITILTNVYEKWFYEDEYKYKENT